MTYVFVSNVSGSCREYFAELARFGSRQEASAANVLISIDPRWAVESNDKARRFPFRRGAGEFQLIVQLTIAMFIGMLDISCSKRQMLICCCFFLLQCNENLFIKEFKKKTMLWNKNDSLK